MSNAQFVAQPSDQPQRHHGGAGHHQPQRRQVVRVAGRVVEQGLVQGGRAGEDGDPFRRDVRSTVSTSNTGCGIIVAPRIRQAITPAL